MLFERCVGRKPRELCAAFMDDDLWAGAKRFAICDSGVWSDLRFDEDVNAPDGTCPRYPEPKGAEIRDTGASQVGVPMYYSGS